MQYDHPFLSFKLKLAFHVILYSATFAISLKTFPFKERHSIDHTRDTCAVSRYFVLLRYTAVYRDHGDTGIVA